jgi:hypothetical protein
MPDRSWFYASQGQQQGPFPETQLRELIVRGAIQADTLVWTEGMTNWQRAGDIPGLMSRPPGPLPRSQPGGAVMSTGGYGSSLSIDFGIWEFIWRSIVLVIGCIFVIPIPWTIVWYTRWIVSAVQVPGRPKLSFTGGAMTIVPWFFGAIVLAIVVGMTGIKLLNSSMFVLQFALYWLFFKWLIASIASADGQPLGLSFSGSLWGYIGWALLAAVSIITIIGWAWVYAAWTRWFCRNIQGTQREVIFKGTGLEFLWRGIVAVIAASFIIPTPWVYRWMMRWMASQTILVQRGSRPGA